jgi:hypothetical protein
MVAGETFVDVGVVISGAVKAGLLTPEGVIAGAIELGEIVG